MLNSQQLEYYKQNGFIGMNKQLFSPEKFKELQADVMRVVNQHYAPTESNTLTTLQEKDPCFFKWAKSPEILDQVEQIIGPNIGLWAVTLFLKRANSEKFVDWHCDSKVLQAYKAFHSLNHVALLIAITPNLKPQGCVRYIPGTHLDTRERDFKSVPYKGSLFGGVIYSLEEREYIDRVDEAISVELNEGEYSFHDIHSIHASDANSSDQDRILLNFKYFPTDIVPRPDKLYEKLGGYQQCYLVRGADLSNAGILKELP